MGVMVRRLKDILYKLAHLRYLGAKVVALQCTVLPSKRLYTNRTVLVVYRYIENVSLEKGWF